MRSLEIVDYLDIDEYLQRQDEVERKSQLRRMFFDVTEVINYMPSRYNFDQMPPKISIKTVSEFEAFAAEGFVRITEGVIDFCLKLPQVPLIDEILCRWKINRPRYGGGQPYKFLTANAVFSWIMCHEAFHGFRRHDDAERALKSREFGEEAKRQYGQALEYDADLCGIADTYRLLQRRFNSAFTNVPDIDVRTIVACALYAGLRSLPKSEGEGHLSNVRRLNLMLIKLSFLWEEPSDQRTPEDVEDGKAAALYVHLYKSVRETEQTLAEISGSSFWQDFYDVVGVVEHETLAAWEEIRGDVARASGSRA